MELVDRLVAFDRQHAIELCPDLAFCVVEGGVFGVVAARLLLREVAADGVRNHEEAIGQALHQRAGAESVRPVVGEVGLAEHEQTGDGAHQVVVHPEAAHGVVRSWVDAHGRLVGALRGDLVVNVEEVSVLGGHLVPTVPLDHVAEV